MPIYLGGQIFLDQASTSSLSRVNCWMLYKDEVNGIFSIPMEIPEGYEIQYRLSASFWTYGNNRAIIGFNGIELISSRITWTGSASDITVQMFSNPFKFTDLPDEKAYAHQTNRDAINFFIKSSVNGTAAYARNITLHAYLVRIGG